jgi:hypothetical protein
MQHAKELARFGNIAHLQRKELSNDDKIGQSSVSGSHLAVGEHGP